jgi:Sulfotransferase family
MLKSLLETKRKKDKKRNKKPKKTMLQVPTPIFVPSLPKSGTTTVHEYFQCGGQKSAHLIGNSGNATFKIGRCAHRNIRQGEAPFDGCGDYDVWTDTGAYRRLKILVNERSNWACTHSSTSFEMTGYVAARYHHDGRDLRTNNIQCFYPLIDALEEVYTAYPNATFLFVVRETDAWLKSIRRYHDGFIMEVWKRCRSRGFPTRDGTLEDFREFYEWHKDMIRNFALDHPSWTYIEVDLESLSAGELLEERVGISAECWGHFNKGDQESNTNDELDNSTNDTEDKEDEER